MATTHLQRCLADTTKPISFCLPVATGITKIRKVWLLYDHSTRLLDSNANVNITVTSLQCVDAAPWGAPGLETQSTKHQLNPSYERRPVLEFGASLGGLWEQAGAEPFVLRTDYQEAASRCSAPGETGSLSLGGMGQIHSPHFSH